MFEWEHSIGFTEHFRDTIVRISKNFMFLMFLIVATLFLLNGHFITLQFAGV